MQMSQFSRKTYRNCTYISINNNTLSSITFFSLFFFDCSGVLRGDVSPVSCQNWFFLKANSPPLCPQLRNNTPKLHFIFAAFVYWLTCKIRSTKLTIYFSSSLNWYWHSRLSFVQIANFFQRVYVIFGWWCHKKWRQAVKASFETLYL